MYQNDDISICTIGFVFFWFNFPHFSLWNFGHLRLCYLCTNLNLHIPMIMHNRYLAFLYWLIDWFIVLNATFRNISAISWRPVLVVEEAGVPGENHRLYHLRLQVECSLFCNLQIREQTHAILVTGLYELLGKSNYLTHWATRALVLHF